jgi:Xaa-Pro dipeptidase
MLTAKGCKQRRQRLWDRLDPKPDNDHLRLHDPLHLMYLANFSVDPFSLGGGFGGYLMLRKDGHAKLLYDNRLPDSVDDAHVEERMVVPWYDAQAPARGPRQLALLQSVNPLLAGLRIHDQPGDPYAKTLIETLAALRRQKDPDEIALMRECMRATDA